jgi:hypothetical protein
LAVDATGTPTSPDSIPTYNTAADAPSGKGLNNIVAALQTALSARIPKTLTTTTGDLIYASAPNTPARLGVGSNGQALVVAGGVPSWGAAGAVTSKYTTLIDVVNTASATDILQAAGYSVPGNTLGASGTLRFKIAGDWRNNTGGTVQAPGIKLIFGGTTLFDSGLGANSMATNALFSPWVIEGIVQNMGATNSQWAHIWGYLGGNPAAVTGLGRPFWDAGAGITEVLLGSTSAAAALDTTLAKTLQVQVSLATASVNHEFRARYSIVEVF